MVDARRSKTHPYSILQVPTTQLAKMSIDLKFVELTADVLEIFFIKWVFTLLRDSRCVPKKGHIFFFFSSSTIQYVAVSFAPNQSWGEVSSSQKLTNFAGKKVVHLCRSTRLQTESATCIVALVRNISFLNNGAP